MNIIVAAKFIHGNIYQKNESNFLRLNNLIKINNQFLADLNLDVLNKW